MIKTVIKCHFIHPSFHLTKWDNSRIRAAIRYSSINLSSRHHITIDTSKIVFLPDENSFKVTLFSDTKFNHPGNRLRGISSYLLKNYKIYKKYKIGSRLMIYQVIRQAEVKEIK